MKNILIVVLVTCLCPGIWAQENRSISGEDNNLLHPEWNAQDTELRYQFETDYADGISISAGSGRPNPRQISNNLFSQLTTVNNAKALSDYIWVFGQFIDHDISIVHDEPNSFMPITVPAGDEHFTPGSLIPMSRSAASHGSGTSIDNPRKVNNAITGWIDASSVYGSDDETAFWLRTFTDGKLKTSIGDLLPFNTNNAELNGTIDHIAPDMANPTLLSNKYFVAGDERANENSLLLSIHTIFLREHNRICEEKGLAHPEWSDEQLYQYARKMVGALIQSIVYEEWLPEMGVNLPEYEGYFADINPIITNIFSAAAYRWGHSLVSSEIVRMDDNGLILPMGNLDLKNAFFNPMEFVATGGVDPFLKGMGTKMHQEMDCKVVDDIRNFLFGSPDAGGLDLVSINIMRGRERGLKDFNAIRADLGLSVYNSWLDYNDDPEVVRIMQDLYGDVNNVDAWVGMLAERHMPDALFGETVMRIMEEQFLALRGGDRFYYENDESFSAEEIADIKKTRLYDVLMRNTNIEIMQKNVFAAIPHAEIPGSRAYVIDKELDFVLFPNPVVDDIFIKIFTYEESTILAQFTDAKGSVMYRQEIEVEAGRNVLHLGSLDAVLPPGIYHLSVSTAEVLESRIFVKN